MLGETVRPRLGVSSSDKWEGPLVMPAKFFFFGDLAFKEPEKIKKLKQGVQA